MSGGSLDYFYSQVNILIERIKRHIDCEDRESIKEEKELISLLKGLSKVLRALEWWYSGDTGQKDFQKEWAKFKRKRIFNKRGK